MKLSFDKKTEVLSQEKLMRKFIWSPTHPHRDWKRIIGIFSLLTIGVVIWSSYIFFFYQSDVVTAQSAVVNDTTTTRVRGIENTFKARPVVDPAI